MCKEFFINKRIIDFIYEFSAEIAEIDPDILECAYFRLEKIVIAPFDECIWDVSMKEFEEYIDNEEDTEDETIQQFCDDDEVAACLFCEGDTYEGLYYYESFGKKKWGDDTKKIYDILNNTADKYGLWYEWCGGRIAFYINDEHA